MEEEEFSFSRPKKSSSTVALDMISGEKFRLGGVLEELEFEDGGEEEAGGRCI